MNVIGGHRVPLNFRRTEGDQWDLVVIGIDGLVRGFKGKFKPITVVKDRGTDIQVADLVQRQVGEIETLEQGNHRDIRYKLYDFKPHYIGWGLFI